MKVTTAPAKATSIGRLVATFAVGLALLMAMAPAPAHAITRSEIINRANGWVRKRVFYSQAAYYGGYRQDCSGYVSMAWKLDRSLTTRNISRAARVISPMRLKAGDAILMKGHITIFEKWHSRRKGLYVAYEESGRGKPALHRVKKLPRRYTALRYKYVSQPAAQPSNGTTDTPVAVPSDAGPDAPQPIDWLEQHVFTTEPPAL